MEIQATPFPGKSQPLRQKTTRKTTQAAPKGNPKDPPVQSQRRVFGTTRNPNIPSKSIDETNISKTGPTRPEKPQIKKPSIQVSPNKPKSTQTTTDKKSPEKNRAKPIKKKKSVGFREEIGKSSAGFLQPEEGDGIGPRTPVVVSPAPAKPKRGSSTPYQSAERCSKCRFDRLETSAYWLGQIKLAESVGKHFVSAGFFRLALESKAEPIRSLRMELKRYVARHEYLSAEAEWRDVSVSYGLILQAGADAANSNNGSSSTLEHKADEDTNNEQAMEPPET